MGSVTLRPTIVVGLGEAGCRMAAAVNERATEENVAEHVKVLGIDSRPEDAAHALPTDVSQLILEIDEALWNQEQERLPYLGEGHELPQAGGAARQRPVGRCFVDNPEGLEQTWQFLEQHIEEFVTKLDESVSDTPVTELNVWVVNSLAGGTGSGAFPLVAGLLDELLSELEAERRIETALRGVGSLLRLDRLAEQVRKPERPPSYYLNAYTALSDLQVLLDEEPTPVSLHPDASQYVQNELDVGGVFDQYILIPVHEQERKYLNSVNRVVTDAIYYFGATTAIENFPNHPEAHTARLFSLDGGELAFPVETADKYLKLNEDIASTREDLDQLEREREDITEDLSYLDAILSLDRDNLPSSNSPVPRKLVRRCEDEATAVERRLSPEESTTRIDEAVADLKNEFEPDGDRAFDSSAVLRYLFLSRLVTVVEQRSNRVRDKFSELVTTLVDTYRDQLREYFDEDIISTAESNPTRAAELVDQLLEEELDRLTEQREESLPLIDDFFGNLRTRIEETEETLDELRVLWREYDRYQTLSNEVREQFHLSRDRLSDLRSDIEETRYELDDHVRESERELESMQMQRERIATELSEHTRGPHRTTIGVEELEWLDADILERARKEGFTTLVEADLIEVEAIEEALGEICSRRQEPIQDRQLFQPPFSVLAPILAEENTEEWMAEVDSAAMEAGFDMVEELVDTTDTLSIGLLAMHADIQLEGTSEFGTLDEYFTDSDRSLSELFGSEIATVPDPVAYPELQ